MEDGVIGYFDFTNISNYANLKGVTDPKTYLENIKADGYATSIDYVSNLLRLSALTI
jgi:flagellum-specific peptidoglycan hydrolase FlgJ